MIREPVFTTDWITATNGLLFPERSFDLSCLWLPGFTGRIVKAGFQLPEKYYI